MERERAGLPQRGGTAGPWFSRRPAAKWALEAGHPDRGLEIVTRSLIAAEDIVSDMLREVDTGADFRRRP